MIALLGASGSDRLQLAPGDPRRSCGAADDDRWARALRDVAFWRGLATGRRNPSCPQGQEPRTYGCVGRYAVWDGPLPVRNYGSERLLSEGCATKSTEQQRDSLVGQLKQAVGTLRPPPRDCRRTKISSVPGSRSCILCEPDVQLGNSGLLLTSSAVSAFSARRRPRASPWPS